MIEYQRKLIEIRINGKNRRPMNAKCKLRTRNTSLLFLLILLSSQAICQKIDPELIIDNFLEHNCYKKKGLIESVQITGTRSSVQNLKFKQFINNQGKYTCETEIDGWVIVESYENGKAYIQNPFVDNNQAQDIPRESLDYLQMFEASDLEGMLYNRKDKGIVIKSCSQVTIADREFYKIEIGIKDLGGINYYLGKYDYLIYRKEYLIQHSENPVIITLEAYKYVDDIPFATKSRTIAQGELISTIVIDDIELVFE